MKGATGMESICKRIWNCMEAIVETELGTKYSYHGHQGKKPFNVYNTLIGIYKRVRILFCNWLYCRAWLKFYHSDRIKWPVGLNQPRGQHCRNWVQLYFWYSWWNFAFIVAITNNKGMHWKCIKWAKLTLYWTYQDIFPWHFLPLQSWHLPIRCCFDVTNLDFQTQSNYQLSNLIESSHLYACHDLITYSFSSPTHRYKKGTSNMPQTH